VTLIDGKLPCKDCKRTFKSASALRPHRASVKHKPLSNLTCPLGKNCTMRFTSPSALIQHLESGGCDSKTTRDKIYGLIKSHDLEQLIHSLTKGTPPTPRSYPSSEPSPTDRLPRTPDLLADDSGWSLVTSPSILSLDESVTGWSLVSGLQARISDGQHSVDAPVSHRLRCPHCPKTRKGFSTAQDLKKHMASPVHCPKVYHCPTGIFSEGRSSRQKAPNLFSTLGGLAQHLESGACQGGNETFNKIVEFIERRLELLGFRKMPLLLAGYRGK
jgi:Zinc finger, C2H2 type/Zinc-finger of C2H2 type